MYIVEVPASGPQALGLQVTILTMMTSVLVRFSHVALVALPSPLIQQQKQERQKVHVMGQALCEHPLIPSKQELHRLILKARTQMPRDSLPQGDLGHV